MANGTQDYKWGQVETKVEDLKEDFSEWKLMCNEQHRLVTKKLDEVKTEVREINKRLVAVEVKSGFIGAFAGIGAAIATVALQSLL